MNSWGYDSTYRFFIDAASGFFIDKFYKSNMKRERISSVLSIGLMMKVLRKAVKRPGKGRHKMDYMDKDF